MWKLTKYEFRKNLTSALIVLLIVAAAQIYYTISWALNDVNNTIIAASILLIVASISFIVIIAFGISTYSKELSSKSSYLIFMTPNSSLKIILSKMLYTVLFGLLLVILLAVLGLIDIQLMASMSGNPLNYIEILKELLSMMGIDYFTILYGIITGILSTLISLLFIVALTYFAITLSSTLLQNKKAKGFLTLFLFIVILLMTSWISNQLPVIYEYPANYFEAITTILPSVLFELVIMLGCIFGSAALLDKKVSL